MIAKRIWYHCFKWFLKISLHFYTQRIKIRGKENIPKKGAVLFAANHPNALLDPLYIAAFNKREIHFLVRADVFKKPLIKKMFASLNMMPIYRMRDGRSSLANNDEIFNKCYQILKKEKSLLIFPQGGHSRERTIPPLSKGFTRIIFGSLEENPDLEIQIVPVGITYQNSSVFPAKVAVNYGTPIATNQIIQTTPKNEAIATLKQKVSDQLKELSVHIPKDEHYETTLNELNEANIDFTKVLEANEKIHQLERLTKEPKNWTLIDLLKYPLFLNSLVPLLIWRKVSKKIKDIEFVDTFRFGVSVILVPICLGLQSWIFFLISGNENWALLYLAGSTLSILIYTKLASTHTE
ncbi:MAG: acyltransferase [Flavobacteriaceae bacterium]|nr:acyltransferase [Flavobacteriaceae bacterium]|tara:strand:+ start:42002 stop:43054 length:1053 start_codon:yes stop_codon:yes gene_type:complete